MGYYGMERDFMQVNLVIVFHWCPQGTEMPRISAVREWMRGEKEAFQYSITDEDVVCTIYS